MPVLRNVPVVKVSYSKIEECIKYQREIKQRNIKPIIAGTYNILNLPVDTKNPERLDQQVKKQ